MRRRLPQPLLTAAEALRLLESIKTRTRLEQRDRAIVEVLYSTGIRNAEIRALRLCDFDPVDETLFIVAGKGNEDRVVPLGPITASFLSRYIVKARPKIARDPAIPLIFVSKHGRPLDQHGIINAVRRHLRSAGIDKPVRPHRLRHACATHMLRAGADIRYIQPRRGLNGEG